jgi:hypothetical protein
MKASSFVDGRTSVGGVPQISFRARFSSHIQRGARGRPPPNRFYRTSGTDGASPPAPGLSIHMLH